MTDSENAPLRCPACAEARWDPVPAPGDDFALQRCLSCGTLRIVRDRPMGTELYERFYRGQEARRLAAPFDGVWRWLRDRRADPIVRTASPGDRILDVGCERGELLHRLHLAGCEVHGTQLSSTAAAHARSRFGLDVFVGELDAAPFADRAFDAIAMLNVLEHLPDPDRYVSLAGRMLRPGGLLWIELPNVDSPTARLAGARWLHHDPHHHLWGFNVNALRRLLVRHGFTLERVYGMSWEFGPVGAIQAWLDRLPGPRGVLFDLVREGLSARRAPLQLAHALATAALLPAGVLIAIVEAAIGQGQVVLVRARRS